MKVLFANMKIIAKHLEFPSEVLERLSIHIISAIGC